MMPVFRDHLPATARAWRVRCTLAAAAFMVFASGVLVAQAGGMAVKAANAARARLQSSAGGRLVLAAIEAHGGLDRWYATPTSAFAWEYSNLRANLRFQSYLVADNRSRRIYHELRKLGQPDAAAPAEGRFAWNGEEAWISPGSLRALNPRFWSATGYYFVMMPFVFADPGLHYEVLPDEQLDGRSYDMVRVSFDSDVGDTPDDRYTLYLDKRSHRLRAIRYTVTFFGLRGDPNEQPQTLFQYDEYQEVGGLQVPTRQRGFAFANGQKGEPRSDAWTTEISFGVPFDEAKLELPEDAWVAPAP